MKNLWEKTFNESSIQKPNDILEEQGKYLSELTEGKIIAKAIPYDGATYSYTTPDLSDVITTTMAKSRTYNIQQDLGMVNGSSFAYEFFITSVNAPNFKYRVMFISYDITFYPVSVTLDETIATELDWDTSFEVSDYEEFIDILSEILNSDRIENVIVALLSANETE